MRAQLAAVCLVGAFLFAPGLCRGADLVVQGCNQLQPGEVGVREAIGDIGDTVSVAVTVNASHAIGAFVLDVDLPAPGLLTYVRTDRGNLTASWAVLGGHYFSASNQVRIGGFDATGIAAGSAGRLAYMVFVVAAAGTGAFGTSDLLDDLSTYVSCEDVHGTSHLTSTEWGSIKSLYRP